MYKDTEIEDGKAESPEHEAMETPEEEAKENEGGTVDIPEAFQQQCTDLIKASTKPMLAYLREKIFAREDEMRKESSEKPVETFDTEGMPEE